MRYLLFSALCFLLLNLQAQSTLIYLENPSFEEQPRAGLEPSGWRDCGQSGESPPDIQPYGGFGVTRPAAEGSTYLGLVVRDNKTWEGISQKLSRPLTQGKCQRMSVQLARSERYESATKRDQFRTTNFNKASVLRVWGGRSACDRRQLLYESPVIEHTEWRSYEFRFTPDAAHTFIIIEAYYKTPTLFHYNGNLLVDALSAIALCEEAPIAAKPEPNINKPNPPTPPKPPVTDTPNKPKPNPEPPKTKPNPEPPKENFDPSLKANELKIGQSFRLDKLYFQSDSSSISTEAERTLADLIVFLKNNPSVGIEIGGHTNGLPSHEYCDRLSDARAKNVADYLRRNGIARERISHKGYGKRKPIADNETLEGRAKNQRVEITITQL